MKENKEMETMIVTESRDEVTEVLDFIKTLDQYEKREFMGIMRGAKLVKMSQERRKIPC